MPGFDPDLTYVAAYGPHGCLINATVRVLFGEQPACGRLPMAIPAALISAGYSWDEPRC